MIRYEIGDVRDVLATIPDGSVDLVLTSPPFLALRSYLPADHPDKAREIGSEPTPAEFLDTLLDLTGEWARVLAPHGSIAVELGDTYSGSGGGGGDYLPGGMRDGQQQFAGSGATMRESNAAHWRQKVAKRDAWPMAKSLCMIPQLYAASLSYGRNLLTGRDIDPWRVRQLVTWYRPNPSVGALADKWRPSTSLITIACKSDKRYWDDAATRQPPKDGRAPGEPVSSSLGRGHPGDGVQNLTRPNCVSREDGAPLHDCWIDDAWTVSTASYAGSHYAVMPDEIPRRCILAMCPPGGVVLDPFAGSGTTLVVAHRLGRDAIGIDLDARNRVLFDERLAKHEGGLFLDGVAS